MLFNNCEGKRTIRSSGTRQYAPAQTQRGSSCTMSSNRQNYNVPPIERAGKKRLGSGLLYHLQQHSIRQEAKILLWQCPEYLLQQLYPPRNISKNQGFSGTGIWAEIIQL